MVGVVGEMQLHSEVESSSQFFSFFGDYKNRLTEAAIVHGAPARNWWGRKLWGCRTILNTAGANSQLHLQYGVYLNQNKSIYVQTW